MNCDEANVLLHALIDGELDADNARKVEAHIAGCAKCAAAVRDMQDLRKAINPRALRYAAPPGLRRSIQGKVPASPATAASRRAAFRGFALGAAATALAASGLLFIVTRNDERRHVLDEIVSAHLRSLQGQHLTDVASSDQHTVKPWFNGRLQSGRCDRLSPAHPRHQFVLRAGSGSFARGLDANLARVQRALMAGKGHAPLGRERSRRRRAWRIRREVRGGAGAVNYAGRNFVVPSRLMRSSRSTSHDR